MNMNFILTQHHQDLTNVLTSSITAEGMAIQQGQPCRADRVYAIASCMQNGFQNQAFYDFRNMFYMCFEYGVIVRGQNPNNQGTVNDALGKAYAAFSSIHFADKNNNPNVTDYMQIIADSNNYRVAVLEMKNAVLQAQASYQQNQTRSTGSIFDNLTTPARPNQNQYAPGNNSVPAGLSTSTIQSNTNTPFQGSGLMEGFNNNPLKKAAMENQNKPDPMIERWATDGKQTTHEQFGKGQVVRNTSTMGIYIPEDEEPMETQAPTPKPNSASDFVNAFSSSSTRLVTAEEVTEGLMEDLTPKANTAPVGLEALVFGTGSQTSSPVPEPMLAPAPVVETHSHSNWGVGMVYVPEDDTVEDVLSTTPEPAVAPEPYSENVYMATEYPMTSSVTEITDEEEEAEKAAEIKRQEERRLIMAKERSESRARMKEAYNQRVRESLARIVYSTPESTSHYKRHSVKDIWESADATEYKTLVTDNMDGDETIQVFSQLNEEEKVKLEDHIIPDTSVTKQVFGRVLVLNRDGEMVPEITEVADALTLTADEMESQMETLEASEKTILCHEYMMFSNKESIPVTVLKDVVPDVKTENMNTTPAAIVVEGTIEEETFIGTNVNVYDLMEDVKTCEDFAAVLSMLTQSHEFVLAKTLMKRFNQRYNDMLVRLGYTNAYTEDALKHNVLDTFRLIHEDEEAFIAKLDDAIEQIFAQLLGTKTDNQEDLSIFTQDVTVVYLDTLLHEMNMTKPETMDALAPHGWFEVTDKHHSKMYDLAKKAKAYSDLSQTDTNGIQILLATRDACLVEIMQGIGEHEDRIFLRVTE